MTDKVCMITGGNTGIGKATGLALAKRGVHVVLVCRSALRGEAARAEIVAQTGNPEVEVLVADLSLQSEIRRLVEAFKARYDRLDVLINNAAVVVPRRTLTAEGIEMMFAVNHLAYFLLTNLLLDTLKASRPSRIINVSSNAHRFVKRLDFDDLQGEKRYHSFRAYTLSKMENILFTYALARRLEGTGVTANVLHPGVIRTELNRTMPPFAVWLFNRFTRPPEKGAETPVFLALAPEVEGVTGKYFDACHEKATTPFSYDEQAAERLWQLSARLTEISGSNRSNLS